MFRRCFFVSAVVSILLFAAIDAGAARIAVVLQTDSKLQVFDADTYELLGTAPTGNRPHEVIASPDGRYAYVSDFDDVANTISVIDLKTYERKKTIKLDPNYSAHGLDITRDGKTLYATTERSMTVTEIDLVAGKVTRSFRTDRRGTHMLTLSPDEKRLFAANSDGNVVVYLLPSGKRERYIISGEGSEGIACTPDGKQLWTANRGAQTISYINLETMKREDEIPVAGYPSRLAISPDGKRLYVSCPTMGEVSVWDLATRKKVKGIRTGNQPLGLIVSPDSKRVIVNQFRENKFVVINAEALAVEERIDTGTNPDGIAWVN